MSKSTGKLLFVFSLFFVLLLLLSSIFAFASGKEQSLDQKNAWNQGIFLHTGSPLILSEGKISSLDPQNPDVAATVVNGRTLLPLRALSEYFGAEVSYDGSKKEAVIDYKGVKYLFPINENKYIVSGQSGEKEYKMDCSTLILNKRTMVPVRVVCENVLGRKVSYSDRIISISDKVIDLSKETELKKAVKAKIGEAVKAGSLNELKQVLTGGNQIRNESLILTDSKAVTANGAAAQDTEAVGSASTGETASSDDYTKTITQVEGIDEADIVKTDGKYIYISGNNSLRIVGTDQGKLSDEGTIILGNNKSVQEIYVDENRLVLLGTRFEHSDYPSNPDDGVKPLTEEKTMGFVPPYYNSRQYSFVDVYDISNPDRPIFLKEHEMEGAYQTSRKNGDIVYLVSNTIVYRTYPLPLMKDSVTDSKEVNVKLDDVMILPGSPSSGYTVLSAVNISNNDKTEVEAITASGATMYMNDHALYLTENDYDNKTTIIKFSIAGMKIGYAGSGQVDGSLLNQFSMDEHDGYLRVSTTTWEKGSGIYILDDSLNITGSIDGLAEGETIYSVRFIGDQGYVVTFRNMDPLFVFDLSDPNKPVLTGELKIPGLSNYLQPVGENLILGIGADTYEIYRKDVNGNDVVIGSRQGGIKLSLFDISDMGKPKEISKYVIGDSGSYAEAFYNHKAVMLDSRNKNVAFDATICDSTETKQALILMKYENNELTLKGLLDSKPTDFYGEYTPCARRAISIGDVLYYIQGGRISSYDYRNLNVIDSIILK